MDAGAQAVSVDAGRAPGRITIDWPACLLVCGAGFVLAWLLFVKSAGLADQGDFYRMMTWAGISHSPRGYDARYMNYFNRHYEIDVRSAQRSMLSSETLFIFPAVAIQQIVARNRHDFDIGYLAAVHALCYLAALVAILRATRRWPVAARMAAAAAMLFVFCDARYVLYFNSFYSEPASLIFTMAVVASLLAVIATEGHDAAFAAYAVSTVMLACAKPQNIPCGFILALVGIVATHALAAKTRRRSLNALFLILMIGIVVYAGLTPRFVRRTNIYNVIFGEILPHSPDPAEDLSELGLPRSFVVYSGSTAFSPGNPLETASFARAFERTGPAAVVRFYLRHPIRFWWLMKRSRWAVADLHLPYLGNFEASTGLRREQTDFFTLWSRSRALLLSNGYRLAGLLGVTFATLVWLAVRAENGAERLIPLFVAALLLMALVQFLLVITLGIDLQKQLFLCDLFVDTSVVLTAALAIRQLAGMRSAVSRVPRLAEPIEAGRS